MLDGSTSTLQPIAEVATPTSDPSAPPTDAALLALGGVFDSLRAQDATLLSRVRQLEVEVAAYALRAPVDASSQTDISGSVEAVGDSMSPLVRGQKEALDRAVAAAADSEALRLQVGSLEARVAQLQADGAAMRQMLEAQQRRAASAAEAMGEGVEFRLSRRATGGAKSFKRAANVTRAVERVRRDSQGHAAQDGAAVSPALAGAPPPLPEALLQGGSVGDSPVRPSSADKARADLEEAMLKSPASPLKLRAPQAGAAATVKEVEAAVKQLVASQKKEGKVEGDWVKLVESQLEALEEGLAALTDAQAVTAAQAAEASRAAAAGADGVGGAAAAEAAAAAAAAVEKLRTEEAAERAALEGSLRAAATAAAAHAGRVESELKAHVAAAAEAAEATASDVDALRARAAEAEGEIGRAAAEAAKALHRADSAGVSRHELSDLNEKLVRLKDGAAELHARKCDKRALAELAQTLSSAFKGEMSGLERALARAVDDAVAGEVGGLRLAVDELRGEKEGGKKDAEALKAEIETLAGRLSGKAERGDVLALQRGVAALKPGGRNEERLMRIRDALLEMHASMMDQKADKAQLHRLERQMKEGTATRRMPAGTRPAPLHERLLVAHTLTAVAAEARDVPGAPRFVPRRETSPRLRRPHSAAALLAAGADAETLIEHASPTLVPVAARTLQPPTPDGAPAVAARPALVGSDGKFYKASVTPERPMTRG